MKLRAFFIFSILAAALSIPVAGARAEEPAQSSFAEKLAVLAELRNEYYEMRRTFERDKAELENTSRIIEHRARTIREGRDALLARIASARASAAEKRLNASEDTSAKIEVFARSASEQLREFVRGSVPWRTEERIAKLDGLQSSFGTVAAMESVRELFSIVDSEMSISSLIASGSVDVKVADGSLHLDAIRLGGLEIIAFDESGGRAFILGPGSDSPGEIRDPATVENVRLALMQLSKLRTPERVLLPVSMKIVH
ncbi:MAG: DUF3450 domain-containing protein [Planctomycetes bacterium]|nr:DUF3450 domain-containing protein [Planctomycetota bacterium]